MTCPLVCRTTARAALKSACAIPAVHRPFASTSRLPAEQPPPRQAAFPSEAATSSTSARARAAPYSSPTEASKAGEAPKPSEYKGRYQDLASFDPILDIDTLNDVILSPEARERGVHPRDPLAPTHRNRTPLFRQSPPPASALHIKSEEDPLAPIRHLFPDIQAEDFADFHRYCLHVRRFTVYRHRLGKTQLFNAISCVGNGDGMLGLGVGFGTTGPEAREEANLRALKNMTVVNRCEGRTIWQSRTEKLGGTVIHMWPRPIGFGISTKSTVINRICKAAGIKDMTARIKRSRNRYAVALLCARMLRGEAQPIAYGDGTGSGAGDRNEKGPGMRSDEQIAKSLGRRAVTL